jgi:hypothetical protein
MASAACGPSLPHRRPSRRPAEASQWPQPHPRSLGVGGQIAHASGRICEADATANTAVNKRGADISTRSYETFDRRSRPTSSAARRKVERAQDHCPHLLLGPERNVVLAPDPQLTVLSPSPVNRKWYPEMVRDPKQT